MDAASLYAPGKVGDEPALPRAPVRPALFVLAAFAMWVAGPGGAWMPLRRMLLVTGIAADATWGLELLSLAPFALALLWGLLSDRWPIMGARREGHLFCAAVLTAGSWLALLFLPHGLPSMLAGCGIVAAHAIVSVAIGGALAEIGRRGGATGRLAAAWSVSIALAQLGGIALRTPVVGLPAAVGVCAGLAAIVAISMVVSLGTDVAPAPVTPAGTSLPAYLRTRAVWTAAAVVLLAILGHVPDAAIAPGTWPWPLGPVSLTGRLAGAGIYAFVCRRLPFPGGVRLALGLNVIATFALMRASQQAWTVLMVMTATLGAVEGFKFAALNDLFFRASPPRHEGFVCALLTAVAATGWTASRLTADAFRSSVFDITTVAAAAGAAALFTSFLLPASLVSPREGEVEAPSASAHGP